MGRVYTKEKIINDLSSVEQSLWYDEPSANYIGLAAKNDCGKREQYSEIIARHLLDSGSLGSIKEFECSTKPEASYHSHCRDNVTFSDKSPRREEQIAMKIFIDDKNVLDYQLPIVLWNGDTSWKNHGKVDLVYLHEDEICLVELKSDKSKDTLLRCILEIETYFRKINKEKLKQIFGDRPVRKAIMLFEDTTPYIQYMDRQRFPQTHELLKDFLIFCVHIAEDGNTPEHSKYRVEAVE